MFAPNVVKKKKGNDMWSAFYSNLSICDRRRERGEADYLYRARYEQGGRKGKRRGLRLSRSLLVCLLFGEKKGAQEQILPRFAQKRKKGKEMYRGQPVSF